MKNKRTNNPAIIGYVTQAAVRPRPVWSSGSAYLVSAIAGVVGLGAIWRFPYLVGEHGGGAFILAYIVCISVVALPIAVLESAAGQSADKSPVGLFRGLAGFPGALLGWAAVLVVVAIMSYYFVVSGWTMGYAFDSVRSEIRPFDEFTSGYLSLWLLLGIGALTYLVLLRGVATLERASRYLVALLGIAVLSLAAYAQTLDGASESLGFLAKIDSDYLFDAGTWRAAAGQAFYQMGIGQGFLIAYGSYSPAGLNLAKATGVMALANAAVAIASAAMIFPIVFTFDISPAAGAQLAFTAFPAVLADLPYSTAVGIIFFGLLFIAAFTSCLGGSAVAIATVRDELHLRAQPAALLVIGVIVAAGVPSALSYTPAGWELGGLPVLDAIDRTTGSGVVIAVGMLGCALIAWRMSSRRLILAIRMRRTRIAGLPLSGRMFIRYGRVISLIGLVALAASLST